MDVEGCGRIDTAVVEDYRLTRCRVKEVKCRSGGGVPGGG